ncbi:MAG: DUF4276 family protein [Chloroflexi bacterium]|nr:DUF4276 family protein [Chloroflexota bacterium]
MKRKELTRGRRIVILCEGETEEIAIRYFVKRQWEADGLNSIGIHPIDLRAKLEDVFSYVPRYRLDPHVVAVFTIVDLYGMNRVQHDIDDDMAAKVNRVKTWLRDEFGPAFEGFFYPHVSVHEVEAWLLAEGNCLAKRLKDSGIKPDRYAESRNLDDPPSKRISKLFRNRRGDGYGKTNDGTPLFKCVQFGPVYDTCQHFREFYNQLKAVGQAALKTG